jgi:hypothetical protein
MLLAMPFFVTVIALVVYSLIESNLRKSLTVSFRKKAL